MNANIANTDCRCVRSCSSFVWLLLVPARAQENSFEGSIKPVTAENSK